MALLPFAWWRSHSGAAALEVTLKAPAGRFEIHANSDRVGSARCFTNPQAFEVYRAAGVARAPRRETELQLEARALPIALTGKAFDAVAGDRIAEAWLLDPRMLPQAIDRPTRCLAELIAPEGPRQLEYQLDGRQVAVAGPVARVVASARGGPAVVAPRTTDEPLAHAIAGWLERIATAAEASIDERRFAAFSAPCFVALDWSDGNESDLCPHLFSNVVIGPYPANSGALGLLVAGAFVLDRMVERSARPDDPLALALAAAAADLLQQSLGGDAPQFAGPLADERTRHRVARLADPLRYSRRDPHAELAQQEQAIQLLAPLARERLLAQLAPDRTAIDGEVAIRLLRWLAAVEPEAAVAELCDPAESRARAVAAVGAETRVGPLPAETAAPLLRVELVNEHNGYLESCGCKATEGGGFIDTFAYWRAEQRPAARLLLGTELGAPGAAGYSREANELLLGAARRVDLSAWVAGMRDLVLLSSGELPLDAFVGLPWIACNVVPRGDRPRPAPFIDIDTPGARCRIIGVARPSARFTTRRLAAQVTAEYDLLDPAAAVIAEAVAAPLDRPLVVAGAVTPDAAAAIAAAVRRPLLFCSNDYLVPRVAGEMVERSQLDGTAAGQPIVFGPAGPYFVKQIEWEPAAGLRVAMRKLVDLPGDPAARVEFRAMVQALLEAEQREVELRFVEPLLHSDNRYVGSEACASCHRAEHADWLTTPHGGAWKTLERAQRQRVRNCVACHVVGFGQESGYQFDAPDEALRGVGCEVCHGPGGAHVASGGSRETIRRAPDRELCAACHTIDHSDFLLHDFARFRDRIDHDATTGGH